MTTDRPTDLAMVGLGRMGSNLVRRLLRDGHRCVAFDVAPAAVASLIDEGADGVDSLEGMVAALPAPRIVWLMLPAGEVTERAVVEVASLLEPGDTIVDGGNTHHVDDPLRAEALAPLGIAYVDVGVSGGVFGLERGFCLMVGGDDEPVARLEPILRSLAPGVGAAERSRGRTGPPSAAELGYLHCGPVGAGHFVKMVHNAIEYGLMAAYAEGLNLLARFPSSVDVAEVAELWRRGSVVSSWLLDLTAAALHDDPTLERFEGRVPDSGEGRWAAVAALEAGVPTPVLAVALASRFASRGNDDLANRVLSAMRREFGGHLETPL